jgi:hypothetical protein
MERRRRRKEKRQISSREKRELIGISHHCRDKAHRTRQSLVKSNR